MDNTVLHVKQSLKWVWLPCAYNTQCPRAKAELKFSLNIQQDAIPKTNKQWGTGEMAQQWPLRRKALCSLDPGTSVTVTGAFSSVFKGSCALLASTGTTQHVTLTHREHKRGGLGRESSSVNNSTLLLLDSSSVPSTTASSSQMLQGARPLAWGHLHLPANTHN